MFCSLCGADLFIFFSFYRSGLLITGMKIDEQVFVLLLLG